MLKIATYNILHGYYADLILQNLQLLIEKGVDVVCIQEADEPFENQLTGFFKSCKWEIVYFHNTRACNLAIACNPTRLKLQNAEKILLPTLSKASFIQRLTLNEVFLRGALLASFLFENKTIQITNAHLGWEGGMKQTLLQLNFLKDILDKTESSSKILVGDFNTFAPAMFRRFKTKKVEKVLKDNWINAFPDLAWSCDVSYWVPHDGYKSLAQILNTLHIKMRSALDYVFVKKNMSVVSSEMLDLPGSDHRPLVVETNLGR